MSGLFFFPYRLNLIYMILEAHQHLHWSHVQTKDVMWVSNHPIRVVPDREINAVTHFSMEMEVEHQGIM